MPSWLKYLSKNGRDDMGRENENNTRLRKRPIHLVLKPAGDGGASKARRRRRGPVRSGSCSHLRPPPPRAKEVGFPEVPCVHSVVASATIFLTLIPAIQSIWLERESEKHFVALLIG
jgi:hypothetical protein